jgi:hypothetical protein
MLFDGGLSEHWPDAVMAAFLAFAVWLLQRWISAGDRRDEALSDESRKQGDRIVEHEVRLGKHDVRIDNLEKRPERER